MTEFTILMPCLNEASSLKTCIDEAKAGIAALGLQAEILIADNGSTDNSAQIAAANGARVVAVSRKGYGAAILGGIRSAQGKYIILGDADGSYDFGNLSPFVNALRNGASLVVGNRFLGGIQPGAMPLSHRWGVPLLSALARWRFKANVRDFHCGLRAFDRETALRLGLQCPGMEFSTEIIARFTQSGASVTEVPTILRNDLRKGPSHLRTLRDGWRHLRFILSPLSTEKLIRRNHHEKTINRTCRSVAGTDHDMQSGRARAGRRC
ncbi:MAG: glycosyltransferase family 2 protein [Ruminococcaceae bacterium]|nr:glycosyltransferase family 2 protein [Oscillospiraceae bacterium]